MGGRVALHVALRLAAAAPERLAALVLESASPGIADDGERAARRAADDALADEIERDGVAAFVERWERLPLCDSQRALPASARERLRAQRLASDPRGLANSLRGLGAGATQPLHHRLRELGLPTLLLCRRARHEVRRHRPRDGVGAAAGASDRRWPAPATPSTWSSPRSSCARWTTSSTTWSAAAREERTVMLPACNRRLQ